MFCAEGKHIFQIQLDLQESLSEMKAVLSVSPGGRGGEGRGGEGRGGREGRGGELSQP